jgi:hypothetical protein
MPFAYATPSAHVPDDPALGWQGTSYNHVMSPLSRQDIWMARPMDYPPILDWSLDRGPRVGLFDLCEDPGETRNLLMDGSEGERARMKEAAERLYEEFISELRDAVSASGGSQLSRCPPPLRPLLTCTPWRVLSVENGAFEGMACGIR